MTSSTPLLGHRTRAYAHSAINPSAAPAPFHYLLRSLILIDLLFLVGALGAALGARRTLTVLAIPFAVTIVRLALLFTTTFTYRGGRPIYARTTATLLLISSLSMASYLLQRATTPFPGEVGRIVWYYAVGSCALALLETTLYIPPLLIWGGRAWTRTFPYTLIDIESPTPPGSRSNSHTNAIAPMPRSGSGTRSVYGTLPPPPPLIHEPDVPASDSGKSPSTSASASASSTGQLSGTLDMEPVTDMDFIVPDAPGAALPSADGYLREMGQGLDVSSELSDASDFECVDGLDSSPSPESADATDEEGSEPIGMGSSVPRPIHAHYIPTGTPSASHSLATPHSSRRPSSRMRGRTNGEAEVDVMVAGTWAGREVYIGSPETGESMGSYLQAAPMQWRRQSLAMAQSVGPHSTLWEEEGEDHPDARRRGGRGANSGMVVGSIMGRSGGFPRRTPLPTVQSLSSSPSGASDTSGDREEDEFLAPTLDVVSSPLPRGRPLPVPPHTVGTPVISLLSQSLRSGGGMMMSGPSKDWGVAEVPDSPEEVAEAETSDSVDNEEGSRPEILSPTLPTLEDQEEEEEEHDGKQAILTSQTTPLPEIEPIHFSLSNSIPISPGHSLAMHRGRGRTEGGITHREKGHVDVAGKEMTSSAPSSFKCASLPLLPPPPPPKTTLAIAGGAEGIWRTQDQLIWAGHLRDAEEGLAPLSAFQPRFALSHAIIPLISFLTGGEATDRAEAIRRLDQAKSLTSSLLTSTDAFVLAEARWRGGEEGAGGESCLRSYRLLSQLVYGDALLLHSILQTLDGRSEIKGAFGMRNAYKAYGRVEQELGDSATDTDADAEVRSGLDFSLGAFSYVLSIVPGSFLPILKAIAFEGDRRAGIARIESVYTRGGYRAPESALVILYNILWMPTGMAGTTSGFTKAQAILDGMFSLYPTSPLFLMMAATLERQQSGRASVAYGLLQDAERSTESAGAPRGNILFHLGMLRMRVMDWAGAIGHFRALLHPSGSEGGKRMSFTAEIAPLAALALAGALIGSTGGKGEGEGGEGMEVIRALAAHLGVETLKKGDSRRLSQRAEGAEGGETKGLSGPMTRWVKVAVYQCRHILDRGPWISPFLPLTLLYLHRDLSYMRPGTEECMRITAYLQESWKNVPKPVDVDDRAVYLLLRGTLAAAGHGEGLADAAAWSRGALIALEACLALEGETGRREGWVMPHARWERAWVLARVGRVGEARGELERVLAGYRGDRRKSVGAGTYRKYEFSSALRERCVIALEQLTGPEGESVQ